MPRPPPVTPREVKFYVLSPKSKRNKLAEEQALVCLSVSEYEDLSYNIVEMLRYIKGAGKYMDESDKLIKVLSDEANK